VLVPVEAVEKQFPLTKLLEELDGSHHKAAFLHVLGCLSKSVLAASSDTLADLRPLFSLFEDLCSLEYALAVKKQLAA